MALACAFEGTVGFIVGVVFPIGVGCAKVGVCGCVGAELADVVVGLAVFALICAGVVVDCVVAAGAVVDAPVVGAVCVVLVAAALAMVCVCFCWLCKLFNSDDNDGLLLVGVIWVGVVELLGNGGFDSIVIAEVCKL